jgi:ribosomal subunit interface protein
VDIVVRGRRTEVPDRFRQQVTEKLAKVAVLDPKVIRVDVEVSHEQNPRLSARCEKVEITCRSRGPVIRAEAAAADLYGALDLAQDRLESRLRRAADRRRIHHGSRTPVSVARATAGLVQSAEVKPDPVSVEELTPADTYPMVIREKVHLSQPMSLDQALYEMELVGHDFFVFFDSESNMPSAVYRRLGYDYGVIRLNVER